MNLNTNLDPGDVVLSPVFGRVVRQTYAMSNSEPELEFVTQGLDRLVRLAPNIEDRLRYET
jgi:hypothetical protein